MNRLVGLLVLVAAVLLVSCAGDTTDANNQTAPSPSPVATPPPTGAERYVTVGFWTDPTCSGEPNNTNAFPVHYGDIQCYTWPGRSGENSASRFSCGRDSFSYTQWTTLTCSGGQNPAGTRKTSTLTGCTQDVPPTLYARVVDFSGCAGSVP